MTNKLFGTDGVRGVAGFYPMTADFAFKLAEILSQTVCTDKKKIAIGKDTRISGDMIEAALSAGFTANGIDVILLGIVPTPLVTLKTPELGVDMSLMITASHNPYQDNGIKLIDQNGDKFSDDFYAKIEKLLEQSHLTEETAPASKQTRFGKIFREDGIVEDYIEDMRKIAPNYKALQGLRVVIDCANGTYSYILPQTFKDLGAGVISINNQPDGYNINQNCGSQHTKQLAQTAKDAHAHFGIAVDGDGDRIILVDNTGVVIDGDQLLCFLAQYLKAHGQLNNNTVVSTEWSNLGLGEYLRKNGFIYFQSKVGERYVIDLMKEKFSSLGGEPVGHIVLSQYAKSGDALAVAIILALAYLEAAKPMNEIFPIFSPYPCLIENIRFSTKEFMQQSLEHDDVQTALNDAKKVLGENSNLIARKSGTEPVIKLRIEGKDEQTVARLAKHLKQLILQYQK